jgi:ribosomal protein RSM22 (predicted rRNA methylase)
MNFNQDKNRHNNFTQRGGAGRAPPAASSTNINNQPLVQKLAGAIQNLRRDRDMEYRAKAEAEERLRLAQEEHEALVKIVAELKAKHEKILQTKATVHASLGPLEAEVHHDLAEKVRACGETRCIGTLVHACVFPTPTAFVLVVPSSFLYHHAVLLDSVPTQ